MDPISYTSAFSDLPNPGQSLLEGLKMGVGIQQLQQAQTQQQAQVQRTQQMQQMAAQVAQNPTPQAIAQLSIAFPEMSEQFKRGYDMMTSAQQQADLNHMSQVYAAVQNGRPDLASQLLRDRATALTNSGDVEKAKAAKTMADWVEQHPDTFKTASGVMLASVLGPDKFASAFQTINEEPAKAREANAKADTAEADATLKNLGIIGQTLGALQGKNVKPEQVQTALKSLVAKNVISSDELQGYLAAVPSDPSQLNDWLGSMKLAGMKPEDQMKYTAPDANTVANNKTQLAVQSMINERQERAAAMNVTHGIKGLTPEQNEALFGENGAVTLGKLDPNKLNSRTAPIFADAYIRNPNIDMAKISGDIALGRNPTFRQRAMTAETLPEVMRNMVEAGKKVGFSDNRTVGKMQKWVKGELNDPDMTAYMTMRNDAIMTIAQVMRGNGMTDMAHRAEEEAASPTMSPEALDAWMNAQMIALKPRLEQNRRITRDEPTPHAPALPAGWTVKVH